MNAGTILLCIYATATIGIGAAGLEHNDVGLIRSAIVCGALGLFLLGLYSLFNAGGGYDQTMEKLRENRMAEWKDEDDSPR